MREVNTARSVALLISKFAAFRRSLEIAFIGFIPACGSHTVRFPT